MRRLIYFQFLEITQINLLNFNKNKHLIFFVVTEKK